MGSSKERSAASKGVAHRPGRVPAERPGPEGGKRDENRKRRTKALCDAALALFLEQGIMGTTIDDIVQRAGVAKGSFYRYYNDKTELVSALLEPPVLLMRDAFKQANTELIHAKTPAELFECYKSFGTRMAGAIIEYPDIVRLYLQECRSPAVGAAKPVRDFADEVSAGSLRLTEAARTHGLLRPVNPHVSALAVVGAVERLLFAFLAGDPLGDASSIGDALISLVLEGLMVKPEGAEF